MAARTVDRAYLRVRLRERVDARAALGERALDALRACVARRHRRVQQGQPERELVGVEVRRARGLQRVDVAVRWK